MRLDAEEVAVNVESGLHVVVGDGVVDGRVAALPQQGAVDFAAMALLVAVHELEQGGVVVAGDAHGSLTLLAFEKFL